MKKIEAIINRKNYPTIREKLDALGIDIIDKRNLEDSRFVTKRNRLVPLQKRTLYKLEQYYDKHSDVLESDYRIRSFSDFVNYCIMKYLPTLDKQLKNQTILYEDVL